MPTAPVTGHRAETLTLPADFADRYRTATSHLGAWVTIISGDFVLEGRLVQLFPPDMSFDNPAPVAVFDTGRARVTGPLLAGDLLVV